MAPSDSFWSRLVKTVETWLGGPSAPVSPAQAPATSPVDQEDPLETLSRRALILNFDPIVDAATGQRLTQRMGWRNIDELIAGYIADIDECSGGLVKYSVTSRVDVDAIPVKADGFAYTTQTYLDVMQGRAQGHDPDLAEYRRIVDQFHLLDRVAANEFDEVWMFGGPFFGSYESRMLGPGAFWCNAPPLEGTDACRRRFVMMGFSYERGVGEMLEDLGHRAESILSKAFERTSGEANLWKRFSRYDKVAPGQADVGMMHFAPNSDRDYDWGNPRVVPSKCDDWLHFPDLQGRTRNVNCAEWGNGDIRAHHKWWFSHLPKMPGKRNGISNNWWKYVTQVEHPDLDPRP